MTALAADRTDSTELHGHLGKRYSYPVDAGARIFQGAIVCIDTADQLAKPGATSTTLVAVGIATDQADNTGGADGDIEVDVRANVWGMKNSSGADEITLDDVGKTCYIVDDQTVALTDGTASRSAAGVVADVDDSGSEGEVFVDIGPTVQPA
jgi:hypothetical protein